MRSKAGGMLVAALASALFLLAATVLAARDNPHRGVTAEQAVPNSVTTPDQDTLLIEQRHTPAASAQLRLEVPDDPPGKRPAKPPEGIVARTGPVIRGRFESVQVNVNALGNNVAGDAANEPSIAIDPTDQSKIVIGWRQFDTVVSNFRQAGVAYSHDGGETWTFPGVLEENVFRSDPVLGADPDGNFYYSSLTLPNFPSLDEFRVDMYKSTDGGVTWPTSADAFGGDKQWMTIDRTSGTGRGNIYQNWNIQFTCCPPNDLTRSTDAGASFGTLISIPPPKLKWGTLDVGPDGTLYLAGSTLDQSSHLVARSSNARDPFETPVFDFVRSVNLGGRTSFGGINPSGLVGQVWIATDHSDGPTQGNVYILASVNPPGPDPLDVMFIRSTNGGNTWSTPVRVNDDPGSSNAWQWFGTMSVAPNGRIDAIWNDTRNDPGNFLTELFYSFSLDGGLTWSPNEPITPAYDPSLGYPNQNKLGDYYHMISDNTGASLAYAATFNGEQDVYFLRIAVDCNANGIADDLEISDGTIPDCNENGIPDECDIVTQSSPDCNENEIPDECEVPPIDPGAVDCNDNGIPDQCDVTGGHSPDCNENQTPDECEVPPIDPGAADCNDNGVPDECDFDCQNNGVPDDCECFQVGPPQPEPFLVPKNRYLSIASDELDCTTALRVTFVDLPPPFDVWNFANTGQDFFVGEPFQVCENSGQTRRQDLLDQDPPSDCDSAGGLPREWFWAAGLTCNEGTAHFMDWTTIDVVHLFHEGIVPEGVYDVQVVAGGCSLQDESSYSAALTMTQGVWGDICSNGPGGACTGAADGNPEVIQDVLGLIDKFQNINALQKSRADLIPGDDGVNNGPDFRVTIAGDALFALDAFQGFSYPFTPGDPCTADSGSQRGEE